jgi:hypothetical protein
MPSAAEYRQRAAESTKLADATGDPLEKAMLLQLAKQWAVLADHKAKVVAGQEPQKSN